MGRKRKPGPREPSGRPSRQDLSREQLQAIAANLPHRRSLPPSAALDPRAASALGRACLNGYIGTDQYEAGALYGRIVVAYRASIRSPVVVRCTIGMVSFSEMTEEQAERYKVNYLNATLALSFAGSRPRCEVNDVVLSDIEPRSLLNLGTGLDALVQHFMRRHHAKQNTRASAFDGSSSSQSAVCQEGRRAANGG